MKQKPYHLIGWTAYKKAGGTATDFEETGLTCQKQAKAFAKAVAAAAVRRFKARK